jgi:ribosome recycling factor
MLDEIYQECEMDMESAIEHMQNQFKTLRTGKVTTQVLDGIKVDYYGAPTPLSQVATVLATDATTITVSPWEKPLLGEIEAAIAKANIGVNPNNDGEQIKLFFPPMTVEQREENVKKLKKMGEDAKVAVRNDRRKANDAVKKLEKEKEITEDDSKRAQDNVQKITDKMVAKIDDIIKQKEQAIMTV